jgi:putative SOS response-associated peptidase YedK
MCGRFSLYEPVEDLVERFAVDEVVTDEVVPRWNVAPSQGVLAVASSSDGSTRRLGTFRWGLVPSWAKDPSIGNRMVNARAETVAVSGAFRSAFQRRRCLLPASGFYEWQRREVAGARRPARRPFYLHAADGSPLALAGLWEVWHDAEGGALRTCTVITTRPNATLAPIHDRMPVIVPPSGWDRWLEPEPLRPDEREELLVPAPDDLLVADPVGDRVNSPRNDGPDLVTPVSDDGDGGAGP